MPIDPVDLLKTKAVGRVFVQISNIGEAFVSKAEETFLFFFVFDAYTKITGHSLHYKEGDENNWENEWDFAKFDRETMQLWVWKKWKD